MQRKPGRQPKITDNQKVYDAIKGSAGIYTTIAKRLGVTWETAKRIIGKDEGLAVAYQEEKEAVLDMAEAIVYKSIKGGDTNVARWLLSTIGKNRGFSEKQEIEHSGGLSVTIIDDIK